MNVANSYAKLVIHVFDFFYLTLTLFSPTMSTLIWTFTSTAFASVELINFGVFFCNNTVTAFNPFSVPNKFKAFVTYGKPPKDVAFQQYPIC